LLNCEEFSNFAGEEWFVALLDPCVLRAGLVVVFEGVVTEVFFAEVFFAVEEGEDKRVAIFAFPELSFFLCFFSLSFSPLTERKEKSVLQDRDWFK